MASIFSFKITKAFPGIIAFPEDEGTSSAADFLPLVSLRGDWWLILTDAVPCIPLLRWGLDRMTVGSVRSCHHELLVLFVFIVLHCWQRKSLMCFGNVLARCWSLQLRPNIDCCVLADDLDFCSDESLEFDFAKVNSLGTLKHKQHFLGHESHKR